MTNQRWIKLLACWYCISLLMACSRPSQGYEFYLGTYTSKESKGIYKGFLSADGKLQALKLKAELDNPSFLSWGNDRKSLMAVGEVDDQGSGYVYAYTIDKDTLLLKGRSKSGGAHPCHIAVNHMGDVLVSNYSGGNVGLLKLKDDGGLSPLLDVHQHIGDSIAKQIPHMHSAWFMSGDASQMLTVDLGLDELQLYNIGKKKLIPGETLRTEAGAGPRHLVFHPSRKIAYVVNELNSTMSVVKGEMGNGATIVSSVSTLPNDFKGESYCADIRISADGRFLYASNRGHNSLAIFKITGKGEELSLLDFVSVHGNWPRNFALTPDGRFVMVANQRSDNLVVFKRDEQTGKLKYLEQLQTSSPVCVLF